MAFNAAMHQAVTPFLPLGSNRSPLVFIFISLLQTQKSSKISYLPFSAKLFQAVSTKNLLDNNKTIFRFNCTSLSQNPSASKIFFDIKYSSVPGS